MYERDVDSLKKWLKVTMIYMTANTREEYHELLYSLWPIYQDAVKNDSGPILNALKQELKEWAKGLGEDQKSILEQRLANLHLEPEAETSDKDLEELLNARLQIRSSTCGCLDTNHQPGGEASFCPA